ncbi:Putative secreted protein OS=Afipia felis OX=1035 GN=BN961_01277 PE=4 SV=1 [Afipia felis]
MAQTIASAFAIYFVVWWVTLFAVLPFGVRSQHEGGDMSLGTDPGAPVLARMGRKLLWTTLISAIIFGCVYFAYRIGAFDMDRISRFVGLPF